MRTWLVSLRFANEVRCKTADLLSIQDVEIAQSLDCFLAEFRQRDVNQFLSESLCQVSPCDAGWRVTEQRDVTLIGVIACRREQTLFECVGEIKQRIRPNVGDRPRRKQEHRPTIFRLPDPRTNQIFEIVCREQRQCRFIVMFRVPGDSPGIVARVGGTVEYHDDTIEIATRRWQHFDVELTRVPVA